MALHNPTLDPDDQPVRRSEPRPDDDTPRAEPAAEAHGTSSHDPRALLRNKLLRERRADPPGASEAEPGEKERKKKKKKKRKDSMLGSTRGIETMFRSSYNQHVELSSLADNKSNIMISINGIIISIILASISPKIDANPWLLIPTSVLLISCSISMVYAVLSARPRVSSKIVSLDEVRQNRANILFFGNFVHMPERDYVQGMTELLQNTDMLYYNMIRDIYSLGHVLAKKFKLLRISYMVFMIGLVMGVALYIAVFIGVIAQPAPVPTTTAPPAVVAP